MAGARNPNVGRKFMGSPIAKSGVSPKSLGTTRQEQSRDSGGNILNLEPKGIKSGLPAASSAAPTTGMTPNTQAVGHLQGIGGTGSGKVTKQVAGIQKFYGR